MFNPQTAPDNLVASVSRNRGERATGSFNAPATRTLYYAKHFFKITPTFEKVKSREREANNSAHIYSISHRLAPTAKNRDKGLNRFFGRKIMKILQWWQKITKKRTKDTVLTHFCFIKWFQIWLDSSFSFFFSEGPGSPEFWIRYLGSQNMPSQIQQSY